MLCLCLIHLVGWGSSPGSALIREQAIGAGLAAWMTCLRGRYLGRGWRKTTFDAAICALIAWFARDGLALVGIDNQFSYLSSIIVGYLGNDYLGALLRRRLEKKSGESNAPQ
ncbi:gp30 [Sodalis phage phiSG1]|nr:gp30 [Sodalis phage phiSG1]